MTPNEKQVAHHPILSDIPERLKRLEERVKALEPTVKPVEQKIQLSPGKWVMRNGECIDIDYNKGTDAAKFPWAAFRNDGRFTWKNDGQYWHDSPGSNFDIIAPYVEPVEPQSGDKELESKPQVDEPIFKVPEYIAHECDNGSIRPYPQMFCSTCRGPTDMQKNLTVESLCRRISELRSQLNA